MIPISHSATKVTHQKWSNCCINKCGDNSSKIFAVKQFEDTKGIIRIHKSKDRQHNGQKKKDKRTNNDLQNIHIKLKIEYHEPQ